ncbi:hypothetical protein QE152_g7178 [Popillia japonica]|uniref:Uncharacterized protein n=1 Tax=Popillia japonica TaxID=7064 RepID=A0AAW1MCG0_POPJA
MDRCKKDDNWHCVDDVCFNLIYKGIAQGFNCKFIIGEKPLSEEELPKLAENSNLEGDSEEDELLESSQIDYELSEEEEVLDAAEDDMVHTVDFDVSVTHTSVPITSPRTLDNFSSEDKLPLTSFQKPKRKKTKQSNIRALQDNKPPLRATDTEYKKLIGAHIIMECMKLPRIRMF